MAVVPPVQPVVSCAIQRWNAGACRVDADAIAEEVPVALVYNGISHAVMLATPQDVDDLARGFSLSEGLVGSVKDIYDIEIHRRADGIEAAIEVASACEQALRQRRRTLAGRTGCGLCGVESLEQAACRAPAVGRSGGRATPQALARARAELAQRQKIFEQTGAVHAAAWCRWDGEVVCVREDVGRHNALDKLIGALATARLPLAEGFVLMSSRASYEIVCKAATVGIELVAALSAPTAHAVRIAADAGLTLVGFLKADSLNVYTHVERIAADAGAPT